LTNEHVGRQFRVQDRATNSEGTTNYANGPWSDPVEAKPVEPGGDVKAGTLTNPPYAMMLNWDGPDENNNNPFIDWLKIASEFQTSGSVSMNYQQLVDNGHITADGTILSVP